MATTVSATGTLLPTTDETTVRGTGGTIIYTIIDDTLVSGAAFDAQRQPIIDGMVSNRNEAGGWNALVLSAIAVGDVVRTDPTTITISIPAVALYSITLTEAVQGTSPAAVFVISAIDVMATPTWLIFPNVGPPTGGEEQNRVKLSTIPIGI